MSQYKCLISPAVMTEIERLGGKWVPSTTEWHYEVEGHLVPPAIGQFLYNIQWPPHTFKSVEGTTWEVWDLSFFSCGWLDENDPVIADRNNRPLVYFGMGDGGNYYFVFDIDDANPSDPKVYKVDHYDPEQRLFSPWHSLRQLLSQLKADAE
jgi:hypothetical protein